MGYRTLVGRAWHEDVVKGSRFVALVAPLSGPDEAEVLAAEVRGERSDASHVCWAYVWGDVRRWSDDGEPGGTAGRPMLEVLDKRGLDRAAAIVARRFGGVKLGAGGLARAYGAAVARAVDAAGTVEIADRDAFVVRAPFADADVLLRALADRSDVDLAPIAYDGAGLELSGTITTATADDLEALVTDLTRGRARCRRSPVDDDAAPGGALPGHWK